MAKITAIGKKILELRKEHKMTQGDLAQKVGVSTTAISKFEKGVSRPSLATTLKLSTELGQDLKELLPHIGRFPVLSTESNIEVPIVNGPYNRAKWDYLRRDESAVPDEAEEAEYAKSNTPYAFESLSLPSSMLKAGTPIVLPVPVNSMEPTFLHGDLLVLTHQENIDWTVFPTDSDSSDVIDTFPLYVVEVWSKTSRGIEFGRCSVNQNEQLLWCYQDDRHVHPQRIPLVDIKAMWAFNWCLFKRPQNLIAQDLVYKVGKLQHELKEAKVATAKAEENLVQANAVIGNLLSQLPKPELVEPPQQV